MPERARRVIVHVFSGDLWAGAEVAVFNLLTRLRHTPDLSVIALALNEGILTAKLRTAGIETHVVPETEVSFPRLAVAASRLLKGRRIDVIHSHRYKENLLASLLAKAVGARALVTTIHGLADVPIGAAPAQQRRRFKTRLDYFVLRHAFDRVIAVSKDMKRRLVRTYGFPRSRIEVIHNGIPLPEIAARPRTSGVVHVGSVGRLDPVKRFDLLLHAAARVRMETDAVQFSIVGDGPLRQELLCRIEALRLEQTVRILPATIDPTPHYHSFDIYLNTSLHEGLPLSVLEAMACGRPVVAASVGGIPEIVTHGVDGLLIESSDPRDFARACVALAADPCLRRRMGAAARAKVAADFRDTRMAESYRVTYHQVLPAPGATKDRAIVA